MPEAEAVVARDLTKRYGDFCAVDAVDVTIPRGEAFGFLGPNGAGKTTTMRMVATLTPPTSGSLEVLGLDPGSDGSAIRARLGIVPQDDTLDAELSLTENLVMYGRYFGLSRAEARSRTAELLSFVQLDGRADAQVDELSGGMRRRLTIARALVNRPEMILLDEPTTGLDPQARHLVWERLYRLKEEGRTLILTTHYMDEAEQLCDRLVIMDRGRIVAEGSPRALIDTHVNKEVVEVRGVDATGLDGVGERTEQLPDRVLVYSDDADATLARIHDRHLSPTATLVRRSSLEDVFLTLTGRTLED